jgi:hypothetical protein
VLPSEVAPYLTQYGAPIKMKLSARRINMRVKSRAEIANRLGVFFPWLLAVALLGCGGHPDTSTPPPPTKLLFVADSLNNRVLVYNSPFSTNEGASAIIGQDAAGNAGPGNSATTMNTPTAVNVDASGNLYVADGLNCRVLIFTPPFTTGMAATVALGQTSLTTGTCLSNLGTASATGLGTPIGGVAIDSGGNLWVSDPEFSRVLKYPKPFTTGEAATVAVGQTNFTNGPTCNLGGAPTASTLCRPSGIAFDSSGNLWASDIGNNRVLMYPKANLVTGGEATMELGQPSNSAFASNGPNFGGISASSLNFLFSFNPAIPLTNGIAFDSSDNLWVADLGNNRVLMYPVASLATNGAAATVEFGQPPGTAFTSSTFNTPALGASSLYYPHGVASDSSGQIFVVDTLNSRTLVFTPPFTNGMAASLVLGQTNFTTAAENNIATGQNIPIGVNTSP